MARRDWYLGVASLALCAVVAGYAMAYVWNHQPLRVALEYSERYVATSEHFEKNVDDAQSSAERWFQAGLHGVATDCMILTHNTEHADRVVTIAVTRYLDGGDVYGTAEATITNRDGDVLFAHDFEQSMKEPDSRYGDDIGSQPMKRVWQFLCEPVHK